MDSNRDYIYHYGVPGMKWGVRRQRKADRRMKKLANLGAKYQDDAKRTAQSMNLNNFYSTKKTRRNIQINSKKMARSEKNLINIWKKLRKSIKTPHTQI